jgi:hypothetical protein
MLVPIRYLPNSLNRIDKKRQKMMLEKSRRLYKKGKYYTRKRVASFHSKPSPHVKNALKIYNVANMTPNLRLAKATGCSVDALKKIVKKGEGAYFSSGSRPNQSAQSWGYARLASAITGGKAAAVDYAILEKGCQQKGKAFQYAKTARKKYGFGMGHTRRVRVK